MELDPELARWSNTAKTNAILADIYDILAVINANLMSLGSGKRGQRPKAYPRPGDDDRKKIGKNSMPINELRDWFAKKREQHNKRGESD